MTSSVSQLQSPQESKKSFQIDPFYEARAILVQGPSATPRATLQAYNGFKARWHIIEQRGLIPTEVEDEQKQADAVTAIKVLAAIMLIQYVWPDVFRSFYDCPHLFFYLHALINTKPNMVCSRTEIDEINDLGQPIMDGDKQFASLLKLEIFRRRPDLVRVLSALFELPSSFYVNDLFKYLTLSSDSGQEGPRWIDPGLALLSGDAAIIKFTSKIGPNDFHATLLAKLVDVAEEIRRTNEAKSELSMEKIALASRVIFALGRVGEPSFVEFAQDLLQDPNSFPPELLLRLIYALGHQATKAGSPNDLARSLLVGLLCDEKVSDTARIRAAKLLRSSALLTKNEIKHIFELMRIERLVKLATPLRVALRDTVLNAEWDRSVLTDALRELNPANYEAKDVLIFAQKAIEWPWNVARFVIRLAASETTPGNDAWDALKGYKVKTQAVRWLFFLSMVSRGDRRTDSIRRIGDFQRDKQAYWQKNTWRRLLNFVRRCDGDNEWFALIDALKITNKDESAQILDSLYRESDNLQRKKRIGDL